MANKGFSYKVDRLADSEVKVVVEAERAIYDKHYELAYQSLSRNVKLAGFRPGKAPRAQIEAKLGGDVYNQTIQSLLPEIAAEIVETEKLNPVTQLSYDLDKLDDKSLHFSFTFTNYPEVKLPKLEKLVVEAEIDETVTEKDVNDVIERLYQSEQRAANVDSDKNAEPAAFSIDNVTDEMVVKWNINGAKSVAELQEQVKTRLSDIKHQQNHSKLESAIVEQLVKESSFEVPKALLEQQKHDLMHQYFDRIDELNLAREDFLSAQGTTLAEVEKQKEDEARNKIAVDLVLNQVAKEFNLIPTSAEVEAQIASVTDETLKQNLSTTNGRRYILTMLMQSAAVHKLEDIVQIKTPKAPTKAKKSK
jgi:FKBP-type peptidyl-prolyl cis-trans isomerase (trigger factor)